MRFDEALAYALTLDGVEAGTSYGQPAAKTRGRAFLNVGHEPETSFVLHLDPGRIEWLLDAHPDGFWKTPHYENYPAVLVRYTADEALVREMIESAHRRACSRTPPRKRA